MVVISFLLVIVAAVTLVVGLFQGGIQWIWASIASCVLAMIFLGIGVLQRRSAPVAAGEDDEAEYTPGAIRSLMGAEDEEATPDSGHEARPEAATDEDVAVVPTRTSPAATAVIEADEDEATTPAADETPAPVAKKAATKATREPATKRATDKTAARMFANPRAERTTGAAARTELAKVKGLGDAKIEALLAEFESLEAVRGASVEELTRVKGVGEALAERIREEL